MEHSGFTTLPRITSKTLALYNAKLVILIGEVMNVTGSTARVKAADGGEIMVSYPPGQDFQTKFVQVIGKASFGNTIEAHNIQSIGDDFDIDLYSNAIDLIMSKHSELFV